MTRERQLARSRERLEGLSRSRMDGEALQLEAVAELRRVIGFDRWCWPLADPETLLPGSGMAEHDYGPSLPRALELEYSGGDFAAKDSLGRGQSLSTSLWGETAGDLTRSPRWDEVLRPVGIGDVATVACRDLHGCWGWVEVYRDASDRPFDDADLELLSQTGPALGAALRRRAAPRHSGSSPGGSPGAPADQPAPGVVVLDHELRVLSRTASAAAWIDALPAAGMFASWGMLPPPVYPAATLARSGRPDRAHAMLRTDDGGWVRIDAAALEGQGGGDVVVTLRTASPQETTDLVCRTYGLTLREREVVQLLMAGHDTTGITRHLFISAHTVQDHLKSVFAKLGVHSRREVLATLTGQPPTRA